MPQYDVVVIGAGLAGLTTASRLAQANKKVLLVATGAGAMLLSPACIDVLGFQPAVSTTPVENPLSKLDDFLQEHPDHPYRYISRQTIETGLTAFQQLVNHDALDYQGSPNQNWLLSSAAGAVHPTCLAPTSLTNGALSRGGRMLIVGFKELRDFYPALISQNLNDQDLGVQTSFLSINLPKAPLAAENVTPIELAHAFDNPDFRRQVVKLVKSAAKGYSRIGFPAVLGIKQHAEVMADMQKQLDKTVFEISTLPPSVPGRRLFEVLRRRFTQAGGRLILGSKVADGTIEAGRVTQIRFETANRLKAVTATHYVLATGGIFGGGIQTDAEGGIGKVWEPIFGLPIKAESNRHLWFARGFLAPEEQPFASYGVRVNQHLNPINESNATIAGNLFVIGSTIANADWTHGRTGTGTALATAASVVEQIA